MHSKPKHNIAMAKELLGVRERKREIEIQMSETVQSLRRAYRTMFRDLESILNGKAKKATSE